MARGSSVPVPAELEVLETAAQWSGFLRELSGKRVLHVKGFGSGFKDPTPEQKRTQEDQDVKAQKALSSFGPDCMVVDGDPWGEGFQRYIKKFVDKRSVTGKAKLLWVKNVKLDDTGKPMPEEREKRVKQAMEWATQGLDVKVRWLAETEISEGVDKLFGPGAWAKLQPATSSHRGDIRLQDVGLDASQAPAQWLAALKGAKNSAALALHEAIRTIETRSENQGFEKCSFENAAKGNAIFQLVHGASDLKAHGAISFGGGESVLLEFSSLYLNPGSAHLICGDHAALLPFTRGREGQDPILPEHLGTRFGLLSARSSLCSNECCYVC